MSSSARKLVVIVAILMGGWFLPADGSLFGPAVAQANKSKTADTFEVKKKGKKKGKKKKKKKGKKGKKKAAAAVQQAAQA